MSLKEKIALPVMVLAAVSILSGCGQKTSKDTTPPAKPTANFTSTDEEKLPEPTGKTEDAVNAALEGIEAENKQISTEENEALTSIDDSQETDDFGQAYDENEF